MIDGEIHTRETVIIRHTKLVRNLANRMSGEYEVDDLVSEGNIGLVLAFDRFDSEKNYKFITYAAHMVRGQMLKFTRRPASGPHWPHTIVMLAWQLYREELLGESAAFVADKLDKPLAHVERAFLYMRSRRLERLDGPAGMDDMEKMTLGETMGDHDDESVITVNDFLRRLSERERIIISELMLDKSQSEIGRLIGVSQNHVSRLRMGIQKKYEEYQRGAL